MKAKEYIMSTIMNDPQGEAKQIINYNTNTMSDLKKTGTITEIHKTESGTSKAGKEWEKTSFVIDTNDTYNPLVCFSVFGSEKVENLNKFNKVGDVVTVSFNVSSRSWEKDGKVSWFHNLDSWMIKKTDGSTQEETPASEATEEDDLPF